MQSFHETRSCISHLPFLGSYPSMVGKVALKLCPRNWETTTRIKRDLNIYIYIFIRNVLFYFKKVKERKDIFAITRKSVCTYK